MLFRFSGISQEPLPIKNKSSFTQKDVAKNPFSAYTLGMSNTASDTTAPEFANYCGQSVIVLDIEHTEYDTLAFIQFEDGREDQVPVTAINFLN